MGIDTLKVKMAQVWEKEADALCEGMDVMKLKKVVFAGFEKGEAS
jgi:CRISPR type III-associated protein (TIGR04423 family)